MKTNNYISMIKNSCLSGRALMFVVKISMYVGRLFPNSNFDGLYNIYAIDVRYIFTPIFSRRGKNILK